MINYLVISKKKWNKNNFKTLKRPFIFLNKLDKKKIANISPKIIFFIHWSQKIPPEIFNNFLCIQFHSSNLPKFRGGSPIQNQIIRGIKKTKVTAFKVSNKIDSGDICLKKNLDLNGTAMQIYERMEKICLYMIKDIERKKKIKFNKQKGKPSYFRRRKATESNMLSLKIISIENMFNFIRMLDAHEYPKAYLDIKKFKILFKNVKKTKKKILEGEFKIVKK